MRLPAEWESHECTWMGWPHQKKGWPGRFQEMKYVFGLMAFILTRQCGEKIRILVLDSDHKTEAERILKSMDADLDMISFHAIETDRSWLRDTAPIFVEDQERKLVGLDFLFNGWNRYSNFQLDNAAKIQIAKIAQAIHREPRLGSQRVILEGGAIDVNERSALLTTEECLLAGKTARHPDWTKDQWEVVFETYFGTTETIWLKFGIRGDDTGGHIDDLARFTSADQIVTLDPKSAKHEQDFHALTANLEVLSNTVYNIVKLPMPDPVIYQGQQLPASYCNFYIGNEAVIVPVFNDPNDYIALGILTEIFDERRVIPFDCRALVWGYGAVHCALMQQPKII